jgi:heterodisulfide reductase subunit A
LTSNHAESETGRGFNVAYGRGRIANMSKEGSQSVSGSVMIVGGGIAGMQAALDLADSGYLVKLVEKSPAIGGVMSELDKTFPTNDCAM